MFHVKQMKGFEKVKLNFPVPILVIDEDGKVLSANEKISEVFLYSTIEGVDVFTVTAITGEDLKKAVDGFELPEIERNGKIFKILVSKGEYDEKDAWYVFFQDVTKYRELKKRYQDERPCAMRLGIDNYDELIYPQGEDPKLELSSDIDKAIRNWAAKYDCSINRMNNGFYSIWFENEKLEEIIEDKFSILDTIRAIDTGRDFPASISIGVGAFGKTISETEEFSITALDLALGRGGDQAVIKRSAKIEYFGGNLQSLGKSNKGKSRIVGHALKQLIINSKNVIIMGHRNQDMDSFGASLGIYRLVLECEKEPFIVIDEVSDSLEKIYTEAKLEEYNLVSSDRAQEIATEESLLIVVDTHIQSFVQCKELLNICEKKVVIDHHRKVADSIENPVLSYMESYASSASELVTEILQFIVEKKKLNKLEAEGLLAGIMVDTDQYIMKSGVRTFEASTWLRRQGADPTEVKRFFQEDLDIIKIKSLAILKAEIHKEKIAITTIDLETDEAQILCAQVADELLSFKGVNASFVIGKNKKETVISARSLGKLNVQTFMEKFGGGGHLTAAAAQVKESIDETKWKILEIIDKEEDI